MEMVAWLTPSPVFSPEDLLTIRADRDHYYYGCDTLFDVHPELIHRLCNSVPRQSASPHMLVQKKHLTDALSFCEHAGFVKYLFFSFIYRKLQQ